MPDYSREELVTELKRRRATNPLEMQPSHAPYSWETPEASLRRIEDIPEGYGETEPWIDPTSVFAAGAGSGVRAGLQAGKPLVSAAMQGVRSGLAGAAMDYPIGTVAGTVGERYQSIALPVSMGLGIASGKYIEPKLEAGLRKIPEYAAEAAPYARMKLAEQRGNIPVFHGSPHKFEEFDISKIGTGEGVQAFGHGLYFTDEKEIAEQYATIGAKNSPFRKDHFKYNIVDEGDGEISIEQVSMEKTPQTNNYGRWGGSFEKTFNSTADAIKYLKDKQYIPHDAKIDITESGETVAYSQAPNLYSVTLHKGKTPEQYDYLRWDKPVEKLADKLKNLDIPKSEANLGYIPRRGNSAVGFEPAPIESWTGKDLYEYLTKKTGSPQAASDFLLRAGIDGIKYPAGTLSGIKSGAASNYVVFDPKAATIEAINGQPYTRAELVDELKRRRQTK